MEGSHRQLQKINFEITSNWQINNNLKLCDAVTTITLLNIPDRINLDEVVSLETCVALKSPENDCDPCVIDIKLKNNQRISRIAVVSEGCVLEFFKDSGEYATTIFAEFFDDFEDNSVYFADTLIQPPASESSIKFTKTKSKGPVLWIYGIRLILTEPSQNDEKKAFTHLIEDFFSQFNRSKKKGNPSQLDEKQNPNNLKTNSNLLNNTLEMDETSIECRGFKEYIDDQIKLLEERLIQKLNEMEENTNQKLDLILNKLESKSNII